MPTSKKNGGKKSLQQIITDSENKHSKLLKKINKLSAVSVSLKSTLSESFSLLSAGFFRYYFKDKSFSNYDSLMELFTSCVPNKSVLSEKVFIDNTHPEDRQFIEELFSFPKSQKKKISGQFRLTQKTKDYREVKFFLVNGSYNYQSENEPVLSCVVRDVTKEIKQQKELQRNLEKAEDSDKIKTAFLLNISHNIRTPMNSIMGFAELLSMTDPEPERLSEYITIIKKQSKSLLQLIDNVAEIAKYESGNMVITKTPIDANELLKEVLHEIKIIQSANTREKINIKIKSASRKGIKVYSDAGRIHQVFINLLNHLLRYTTEGIIEIGYLKPGDGKIDFFVNSSSYTTSKEDLKFLFDRFSQINTEEFDRYDDETGLGLTIAKSIVHLLGGKIAVDSDSETGTSFSISLPYENLPEEIPESLDEEYSFSEQFNWKGKVILIVEDEEVNALFLEAIFQETGAQTLYAKNGKQAVELCKSINQIDLILMDIRMPVMNGIKATMEIRKFNKSVPIIAQTALTLQEDREQCERAGCNDSIIKPIEVEELLSLLNKYFGH